MQSALTDVLQELLKLDASEQNGSLLRALAVAVLQAFEHAYLLKVLQHVSATPFPDATAGKDSGSVTAPVCRPGMHLGKMLVPYVAWPMCGSKCTVPFPFHMLTKYEYTHPLHVRVACCFKWCPAWTQKAKSAHMELPGVHE